MNKNKNILVAILVASLLAGGGFYFYQTKNMNRVEMNEVEGDVNSEITKVIDRFMIDFDRSMPPMGDGAYVEDAAGLFSEGGRAALPMVNGKYHLGQALGVQDNPDDGYVIEEIVTKVNPATKEANGLAEVKVSLEYSGGDVIRVFQMSKTADGWKIDQIETD